MSLLDCINPAERKLTIVMFNNYSFRTLNQITNDDSYKVLNPDYSKLVSAFKFHYYLADNNNFTEVVKDCSCIKTPIALLK